MVEKTGAARGDADFQPVAQDLTQGPLPELVPLPDACAFTAFRRLNNRHEQRDELLYPAAGDAGTFERIADEVAAPLAFRRDDDEGIGPARGKYAEAERLFAQALILDRNSWPAHYGMAQLCIETGRKDLGVEHAKRLQALVEPEEFERMIEQLSRKR